MYNIELAGRVIGIFMVHCMEAFPTMCRWEQTSLRCSSGPHDGAVETT